MSLFDIFGRRRREEERRRREAEAQRSGTSDGSGGHPYSPIHDSSGPAYAAPSNDSCSVSRSDSGSSCSGGSDGGGGGGGD